MDINTSGKDRNKSFNTINQKEIELKEENIDNEGIPIITQVDEKNLSVEEYYRINYPNYQIFKRFNFIFVKMGNLITFNFDKKNHYIPKLSIGPQWYLNIGLLVLLSCLFAFLYKFVFSYKTFMIKVIFGLLFLFEYFLMLKTSLTHIKIIMDNKNDNIENKGFCTICKVYYNPENKVQHCGFCGVCVEKMDHHCVWIGKCVAKNNTFYFYGMIVQVLIIYIYVILISVFDRTPFKKT